MNIPRRRRYPYRAIRQTATIGEVGPELFTPAGLVLRIKPPPASEENALVDVLHAHLANRKENQ